MLRSARHRRFRALPSPRLQRGVGLIEVLIAVLVLSIGMLGMVGLQSWSLRNSQSSLQRGMAVVHAYYIADIMRADRINAVNGNFDIDADDATPSGGSYIDASIADWRTSLQASLGADATGAIDCNGAVCDIVVRWDDSRGTRSIADAGEQEIRIEVEL